MAFRKDELEISMLKNISKQSWFTELLFPLDFQLSTDNRTESFKKLITLAKDYADYIDVESSKSKHELTIYKTGKLDPKSELLKQATEAQELQVLESFSMLLKSNIF